MRSVSRPSSRSQRGSIHERHHLRPPLLRVLVVPDGRLHRRSRLTHVRAAGASPAPAQRGSSCTVVRRAASSRPRWCAGRAGRRREACGPRSSRLVGKLRELEGATIRADLETIVGFSKESRPATRSATVSCGEGSPGSHRAEDDQLGGGSVQEGGDRRRRIQPMTQDATGASVPAHCLGAEGARRPGLWSGSSDIVLESAMPVGSDIPGGTITAPMVLVGSANPAFAPLIDVKGKIAVQVVIPQAHMVFDRATVSPRSQDLMKRGAVAVLTVLRHPGQRAARRTSAAAEVPASMSAAATGSSSNGCSTAPRPVARRQCGRS